MSVDDLLNATHTASEKVIKCKRSNAQTVHRRLPSPLFYRPHVSVRNGKKSIFFPFRIFTPENFWIAPRQIIAFSLKYSTTKQNNRLLRSSDNIRENENADRTLRKTIKTNTKNIKNTYVLKKPNSKHSSTRMEQYIRKKPKTKRNQNDMCLKCIKIENTIINILRIGLTKLTYR